MSDGFGDSNRAIYFSLTNGKITRRVKEPTATSKSRPNKNGVTVHEEINDHFTGRINSIEIRTGDMNGTPTKDWQIGLVTQNGKQHFMSIKFRSGYSTGFLRALPNANIDEPITFIPKSEEGPNGKPKTSLFLSQNGKALKWAYTKDNPNGIPPMEKVTFQGEDKWDDTKQIEFLLAMVEQVKAKIKNVAPTPAPNDAEAAEASEASAAEPTEENTGKAPF